MIKIIKDSTNSKYYLLKDFENIKILPFEIQIFSKQLFEILKDKPGQIIPFLDKSIPNSDLPKLEKAIIEGDKIADTIYLIDNKKVLISKIGDLLFALFHGRGAKIALTKDGLKEIVSIDSNKNNIQSIQNGLDKYEIKQGDTYLKFYDKQLIIL